LNVADLAELAERRGLEIPLVSTGPGPIRCNPAGTLSRPRRSLLAIITQAISSLRAMVGQASRPTQAKQAGWTTKTTQALSAAKPARPMRVAQAPEPRRARQSTSATESARPSYSTQTPEPSSPTRPTEPAPQVLSAQAAGLKRWVRSQQAAKSQPAKQSAKPELARQPGELEPAGQAGEPELARQAGEPEFAKQPGELEPTTASPSPQGAAVDDAVDAVEAAGASAPPARQVVLAERSAPLSDVAMSCAPQVAAVAGRGYALVGPPAQSGQEENEYGERNTETTRGPSVHSRLPRPLRLFPDSAGDWGPSEPDKGHGLRARRSPRKKRRPVSRSKAQGSLFARRPGL